jgi:hypothetical protein
MITIPPKAARLLGVALALVAFAVFVRFIGVKYWPNARIVFIVLLLGSIVALLTIPLSIRAFGFYRSDPLKKVNEAMEREGAESDEHR